MSPGPFSFVRFAYACLRWFVLTMTLALRSFRYRHTNTRTRLVLDELYDFIRWSFDAQDFLVTVYCCKNCCLSLLSLFLLLHLMRLSPSACQCADTDVTRYIFFIIIFSSLFWNVFMHTCVCSGSFSQHHQQHQHHHRFCSLNCTVGVGFVFVLKQTAI